MKEIVINFSTELQEGINSNNIEDSLQGELQFLILDCSDIARTLNIYRQLTNEEYFGNTILFSQYYSVLTDALVTQIIISLARLFDSHRDAVPMLKTLNRFEQHMAFRKNMKIKSVIEELINIDSTAKTNFDFKGPRDQCFAHLDKKQIFSRTRVIKCIGNTDDLIDLIEKIIYKLSVLYELCYEKEPIVYEKNIEIPDIRKLMDFKERAENVIRNNSLYREHLKLTDSGLKYYPLGIEK